MSAPDIRPMRQVMDAVRAFAAANGDETLHYFGAEHLDEAVDAGGRCVWVPTTDIPTGAYLGGNAAKEGVSIHIWGAVVPPYDGMDPDVYRDAAYFMRNNVIVAIRNVLNANYQLANSGWYTPASQALAVYGRVYTLNISVEISFPDQPGVLVRGLDFTASGTAPDGTGEQIDIHSNT